MNYTQEMLEQDTLVIQGNGNTAKIKELQNSIIAQAGKLKKKTEISEHETCYSLIRSLTIDEKDAQLRLAVASALEESSGKTIIEIMKNKGKHLGWYGKASMLNEVSPKKVKKILQKMNRLQSA